MISITAITALPAIEISDEDKLVAMRIQHNLRAGGIDSARQLAIVASLVEAHAEGYAETVSTGLVPAASLRGIEDLANVVAHLRAGADVFAEIAKQGRT